MSEFHFHAELFEARAKLIAALARRDILWFSDYPTIDVLHEEYGLEVCGVQEKETALRIGWVMVETFPDWPYGALFLKTWGTGDPGWKVIVAKRPDCEGPGHTDGDGSHRSYPLRDVLGWPRHDPSEAEGEEPEAADGGAEAFGPVAEAAADSTEASGGSRVLAGEAPDGEADAAQDGPALVLRGFSRSHYVRLEWDPDEPEAVSLEEVFGFGAPVEVLDCDGIRELVERSGRPDSGLGDWVGTAWVEFEAIGLEPVHPHREDHREVIDETVQWLAYDLREAGVVGRWSATVVVAFLPAASNESACAASMALERAMGRLRRARVFRGGSRVEGIRTQWTVAFARTAEGGDRTDAV